MVFPVLIYLYLHFSQLDFCNYCNLLTLLSVIPLKKKNMPNLRMRYLVFISVLFNFYQTWVAWSILIKLLFSCWCNQSACYYLKHEHRDVLFVFKWMQQCYCCSDLTFLNSTVLLRTRFFEHCTPPVLLYRHFIILTAKMLVLLCLTSQQCCHHRPASLLCPAKHTHTQLFPRAPYLCLSRCFWNILFCILLVCTLCV